MNNGSDKVKRMKMTLQELRRMVADILMEEDMASSEVKKKPEEPQLKKPAAKGKATSEKRTVVDLVRESITNAITENARAKILKALKLEVPEFRYSDIEIISEPPKTLVRFKNVDGKAEHDVIYLINVSKIV